jgi:hypothetical protein
VAETFKRPARRRCDRVRAPPGERPATSDRPSSDHTPMPKRPTAYFRRARRAAPAHPPPAHTLRGLIMGFRATQLLHVAARLGVADHLAEGPRTPEALAAVVGAEPRALARVLGALAALGVVSEAPGGAYVLAPLGRSLRADVGGSLRALAILYGEPWLWDAYGRMLDSVRTGAPAFDRVHGAPLFAFLCRHPDAAAVFGEAMSAYSAQEAAAVAEAYDFGAVDLVVDVGGGEGALVAALLGAYPHLAGIVYDAEPVAAAARRRLAEAGLAGRATCVGGDFFAAVPGGGSLYLLKSVLHDWDDDACVAILRRCREAMRPGARLLVAERALPSEGGPSEAALFDVNMLVVTGGRERTVREYQTLLHAAGLASGRTIPTASALTLVEGVAAAA